MLANQPQSVAEHPWPGGSDGLSIALLDLVPYRKKLRKFRGVFIPYHMLQSTYPMCALLNCEASASDMVTVVLLDQTLDRKQRRQVL